MTFAKLSYMWFIIAATMSSRASAHKCHQRKTTHCIGRVYTPLCSGICTRTWTIMSSVLKVHNLGVELFSQHSLMTSIL